MPIVKKIESNLIKIANTEIKIGEVYELVHKFDGNAPSGMQSIRATKYPMTGVAEIKAIYFDEQRMVFDTGFYKESFCNSILTSKDSVDELVRIYTEKIKKPYEKMMNKDCSETNTEFWDTFRCELKVNKSFDTKDPKALFELFLILKQAWACNEGEKNPNLQMAKYCVKGINEAKNKEDEKLERKLQAQETFTILINGDKEKLYTIIEYLGTTNPRKLDDKALKLTYARMIDKDTENQDFTKRFLDACNEYNTEEGKLKMQYFAVAQRLFLGGKLERKGGALYTKEGVYLQNTPKAMAEKAVIDVEFRGILDDLFETFYGNE